MNAHYTKLMDYIRSLRLISSHNHHLNDWDYEGIGLRYVLEHSYTNWAATPPALDDTAAWEKYLLKNKVIGLFHHVLVIGKMQRVILFHWISV